MGVKFGKKTKALLERDSKIIMRTTREHFPFVADRAEGDYAWDIEGNRFIDFTTFITVYPFGNNGNAQIRKAIKEQVDKLMHSAFQDFYAELPVIFAEKLIKMFPSGFGKVFFSNSGTEANEDALKLARISTKKRHIIGFYNSFHGRSLGALAFTSTKNVQRAHFGPFVNFSLAPYPSPYRPAFRSDPEECAEDTLEHIEKNILGREIPPQEVAAILFEPIQGEGGYVVPPKSFFKGLRELADKHNILLIDDEVQAGYMRTGKFLALDNFGIKADIYTMAKAVGGGLPLGVTVSKKEISDVEEGAHAGTFGGNLVAVAAGNATLDYVNRNMRSLQSQVKSKGHLMMKRLEEMKEKYEIVGDVRGIGLMLAIELVKEKASKDHATEERDRVISECFNNGLLLLPAGKSVIRLIPPITMSTANLEKGLDILEDAIKTSTK